MAPYELIYWPGLPGRGELVRLLFEESQTPYLDHSKTDDAVPSVLAHTSPSNPPPDTTNPPVFASPILKHGDLLLSQTPNILLYLAPRLGLAPNPTSSPDSTSDGAAASLLHLNQIVLTIIDGLVNEVHDTHHPVAVALSYEDQQPEAKRRAAAFTSERLPKFLAYLQRVLDGPASGAGPWLYGGKLTYADLVLFQCIDGTQYAFPKAMARMRDTGEYNGVFELYEAVKKRPNIKAYLASERRAAYGNGIWRHYPELDE